VPHVVTCPLRLSGLPRQAVSGRCDVGIEQDSNGRMAAQLVQAAGAAWPDAAYRDAQLCADPGARDGWVLGQQVVLHAESGEGRASGAAQRRRPMTSRCGSDIDVAEQQSAEQRLFVPN
jgi:hypothetical protein